MENINEEKDSNQRLFHQNLTSPTFNYCYYSQKKYKTLMHMQEQDLWKIEKQYVSATLFTEKKSSLI